jgi:hypothetical protein
MSEYYEKSALLHKVTIRVRQVTSKDARAITVLNKHVIEHSIDATRDTSSSLEEVENNLKSVEVIQPSGLIYLIAEKAASASRSSSPGSFASTVVNLPHVQGDEKSLPGGLLGYIVIKPYTGGSRGLRSCFRQTASMFITVYEDEVIGRELGNSVRIALVGEAVTRAKEKPYKHIIYNMATGEDQPGLKDKVNSYLGMGFKQVGLLKGIMERNNLQLDRALLQKTI